MAATETPPTPSRTSDTEQGYRTRSSNLAERARTALNVAPDQSLTPDQIVDFLISLKPSIAAGTWRQYKASVNFALREWFGPQADQALARLAATSQTGTIKKSTRTSARKIKGLPPHALRQLDEWLARHPSKWAQGTRLFLKASVLAGLRPIEWRQAAMHQDDQNVLLTVTNAKATNTRGNGLLRTLNLAPLSQAYRDIVAAQVRFIQEIADDQAWDAFHRVARDLLSQANHALWPNAKGAYTFYSARHQFAANIKNVYDQAGVAALMGHATDETATHHYARKQGGRMVLMTGDDPANGSVVPAPMAEETATVRRVAKQLRDLDNGPKQG